MSDYEIGDEDLDLDADQAGDKPGGKRGVRARLAEAEAERDRLRDQLARQHRRLYEELVREQTGLDPELFVSRNIKPGDFLDDDGLLDAPRLTEAVETARLEMGLPNKPKRPKPNPLAGTSGEPSGVATTFAEVFKQHARPN